MRLLLFILLFLSAIASEAKDNRCERYVQDVRRFHYEVFGVDYPYWYGVGQLQQESNCRDIISNDGVGSQGVSQVTYKLWDKYLKSNGVYDLRSTSNQIKAQAYIMKSCKNQAVSNQLWIMYQVYNGGGLVNKEIKRAGSINHDLARKECKRKVVRFSNGMSIDACEINYDYSVKIFSYGQKYKLSEDKLKYW